MGIWVNFSPRVGVTGTRAAKVMKPSGQVMACSMTTRKSFYFDRFADNSPFGSATTLSRPVGGFTNPYQGRRSRRFRCRFPKRAQRMPSSEGGRLHQLAAQLRPTYVQQWNLAVDKQLGPNWLFTAGYLGNRTNHMWLGYDANSPVFIAGNDCSASATVIPRMNWKCCGSTTGTNRYGES